MIEIVFTVVVVGDYCFCSWSWNAGLKLELRIPLGCRTLKSCKPELKSPWRVYSTQCCTVVQVPYKGVWRLEKIHLLLLETGFRIFGPFCFQVAYSKLYVVPSCFWPWKWQWHFSMYCSVYNKLQYSGVETGVFLLWSTCNTLPYNLIKMGLKNDLSRTFIYIIRTYYLYYCGSHGP